MELLIFTCIFLGAIAITFGVIAIYHNLTSGSCPVVAPATTEEDEYILTFISGIKVPCTCNPTRELQLALLRNCMLVSKSTQAMYPDNSKITFLQTGRHTYKAYYVGTK